MKIYIGFSVPTGSFEPFAWLIKKIEARPYDHVYVRLQEPTGEYLIFQASGLAVNLYSIPNWLNKNQSLKEYEIDIADNTKLWQFVKDNLGVPYDLQGDFGILLMKIFHLKTNPLSDGLKEEFCSKLATLVFELVGFILPGDVDTMDPSLLDDLLQIKQLPLTLNPTLTS